MDTFPRKLGIRFVVPVIISQGISYGSPETLANPLDNKVLGAWDRIGLMQHIVVHSYGVVDNPGKTIGKE